MTRQVILTAGQPQEFYEVGDFLRILSAAGPLTLEFYNQGREVSEAVNVSKGYAEKFDRGTFDRVRLVSPTTQPVQFVTRLGNVVNYDAPPVGDTAIVSSVPLALNADTLLQLIRPMAYGASFDSVAALAAGASELVFSAASNVNGAIVHSASWAGSNAGAAVVSSGLIAASVAPLAFTGGDVLMQVRSDYNASGVVYGAELKNPILVPAGKGLWFWNQALEATAGRSVLYTLL